jgi:fructoselysine 6-kinase
MIVSVGDACIDCYVTSKENYAGGIATNFAVQVQRLQTPVILISAIGDDKSGKLFLRQLQHEGVNVDHVQRLHGTTSRQNIRLVGKERTFCGFTAGVLADFHIRDSDIAVINTADAVVAPLTDGLKAIFESVMMRDYPNTLKVADFSRDADIPGFSHGDVVAMLLHYIDDIDAAFIGGDESLIEPIQSIAESNPSKMVTLTLGPKGVQTFFQGRVYTQPAKWVRDMVDTTGCGDAFRAGFLTTYLRTKNIPDALEVGAELAAKTATHVGGF